MVAVRKREAESQRAQERVPRRETVAFTAAHFEKFFFGCQRPCSEKNPLLHLRFAVMVKVEVRQACSLRSFAKLMLDTQSLRSRQHDVGPVSPVQPQNAKMERVQLQLEREG